MVEYEITPPNEPKFEILEGHLNLGEKTSEQIRDFLKTVNQDLLRGLWDDSELAKFYGEESLAWQLDALHIRLEETEIFSIGSSWSDFSEWHIPPTSNGDPLDDSFTINAANIKTNKVLCCAFGPEAQDPKQDFEYRIDFIADYSLPEQALKIYKTEDCDAETPLELLKELMGKESPAV